MDPTALLEHVDRRFDSLDRRIDALAAEVRTINGTARHALLDAREARNFATRAHDAVRTCSAAHADLPERVTKIETAEATLTQRDGYSVRRKDLWLVSVVTGGVLTGARLFADYVWPHLHL